VVTGTAPKRSLPAVHESWLPREHPLYRPRHGRQRLALVCAVVFFLAPTLALLIFGPSRPNENRRPNDFPSLADGWGFFTGLSPWANDQLAFKKQALDFSDYLSRQVFGETPRYDRNVEVPAPGPIAPPPPPATTTDPNPRQEHTPPPTAGFPQVIEGRDGWLYLGFDTQGKCQPSQPLDQVIAGLNRLRQAVEQSGRRFVLAVAPDKSTMVPEYLPDTYGGKDCAAAASALFWQRVDTEVGNTDLRGELRAEAARVHRPVYFQEDTHWKFDGGLLLTRALAERIQPGSSATWRVLPGPTLTSPADLPTLLGTTGQNVAMRYDFAPDGRGDRTNWITSDFRTPLTYQSTPVEGMVTAKTAMIADSYTQFAAGYLSGAFADISITHVEDLLTDAGAVANRLTNADVVVVEVVERHLAAGVSPITNPGYLDTIVKTLAAHPK
jgi:alginate O-acetyltransferase complex protein AlgJ